MIRLQFDNEGQTLLMDFLKEFYRENPILLENILTPMIDASLNRTKIDDIIRKGIQDKLSKTNIVKLILGDTTNDTDDNSGLRAGDTCFQSSGDPDDKR